MGRRPLPLTVSMRDQALAVVAAAYPASITGREVAASLPALLPCRHGAGAPWCASCGLSGRRRPNEAEARRYLNALEAQQLVTAQRRRCDCTLWRYVKTDADAIDAWWDALGELAEDHDL